MFLWQVAARQTHVSAEGEAGRLCREALVSGSVSNAGAEALRWALFLSEAPGGGSERGPRPAATLPSGVRSKRFRAQLDRFFISR